MRSDVSLWSRVRRRSIGLRLSRMCKWRVDDQVEAVGDETCCCHAEKPAAQPSGLCGDVRNDDAGVQTSDASRNQPATTMPHPNTWARERSFAVNRRQPAPLVAYTLELA